MFPELTTSYLAGILGKGDNDVRNANDLWKRTGEWNAVDKDENLLKNLVQVQYPGYKVNKTKNPTFEDFKTTDFKFENPEIKTNNDNKMLIIQNITVDSSTSSCQRFASIG